MRAYLPKEVEGAKLQKILEAAALAPSAGNLQAYRIAVVRGRKLRAAIMEASHGQELLIQAPVLLIFIADGKRNEKKYGKRGEQLYAVQDATIAAAYCQLAAAALGLGTVWVGGFEEEKVARISKCGPLEKPVAIIPVGYPAEERKGHERRSIEDLVSAL